MTLIGQGRANHAGSSLTITAPKKMRELLDVDEDGADVVWFEKDGAIMVARADDVEVNVK